LLPALGWVDVSMLCLLLASMVAGLWRGLIYEVLSLSSYLLALAITYTYTAQVAEWMPPEGASLAWRKVESAVLVFACALLVFGLLARLLKRLVQLSPLGLVDRLLGGAYGLARGVVALVLISMLVTAIPPLAQEPDWANSYGATRLLELRQKAPPGLRELQQRIQSVLPPEVARHLPAL
jgi:membrane protein required for colicin V production